MRRDEVESKALELFRRTAFDSLSFHVGGTWEGVHIVTGERVSMRVHHVAWYARLAFLLVAYAKVPFGRELIMWARRGVSLSIDPSQLEA
jgi:hypothetical protein